MTSMSLDHGQRPKLASTPHHHLSWSSHFGVSHEIAYATIQEALKGYVSWIMLAAREVTSDGGAKSAT